MVIYNCKLQDYNRQVRAEHGIDHSQVREVRHGQVQASAEELVRHEADVGRRCGAGQAGSTRRPDRSDRREVQEGHRKVEETGR